MFFNKSKLLGLLSVVGLLSGGGVGCGSPVDPEVTTELEKGLINYGSRPNGTGVHVSSTAPESWLGLGSTTLSWFMDGFTRRDDGSYWASGWYSLDVALLPAPARVVSAQYGGRSYTVQAIRTTGSRLSIDLRDGLGQTQTLQDAALVGLSLQLRVPAVAGLLTTDYQLRISSADIADSQFGDVFAYQMEYAQSGLLLGIGASSWKSYCTGSDGGSQRSVFYQGSQWNPLTAARSDGQNLITMTCETGAVAQCMSWGYRPWGAGNDRNSGQPASFRDYHQACIHMKRAAYCGDSKTNTVSGTWLYISDQLETPIQSAPAGALEALWTPSGATCVSNRRHPEIPFLGCPLPLPPCPATPTGNYLLANGVASSGSLFGLLD